MPNPRERARAAFQTRGLRAPPSNHARLVDELVAEKRRPKARGGERGGSREPRERGTAKRGKGELERHRGHVDRRDAETALLEESAPGGPREEAQVCAVEDAAGSIRETAEQKAEPNGEIRDVREREQENAARFQEGFQGVEEDLRTRQVLEDVAGHDHVEGLPPRPGDSVEEIAGHGLVEERSAFLRGLGVELDASEVTTYRTDASGEEPGAEAEIENGEILPARQNLLEEKDVRRPRDLLPGIALCVKRCGVLQSGVLCAIGIRRPLPNAFADTLRPGAA